jgi:hypothetical protein
MSSVSGGADYPGSGAFRIRGWVSTHGKVTWWCHESPMPLRRVCIYTDMLHKKVEPGWFMTQGKLASISRFKCTFWAWNSVGRCFDSVNVHLLHLLHHLRHALFLALRKQTLSGMIPNYSRKPGSKTQHGSKTLPYPTTSGHITSSRF